jgi:hypothetical protein
LHPELAGLLDDDAQPFRSRRGANPRVDRDRNRRARSPRQRQAKSGTKNASHYLIKIARLGGYLALASDPPPDNTVMRRGLSPLTDIALGALVRGEFVGN